MEASFSPALSVDGEWMLGLPSFELVSGCREKAYSASDWINSGVSQTVLSSNTSTANAVGSCLRDWVKCCAAFKGVI
jgi:hypothetical protein